MAYSILKRASLSIIAVIGLAAGTAFANSPTYSVPLNKNELVRLPVPASAVIIGDPSIANPVAAAPFAPPSGLTGGPR